MRQIPLDLKAAEPPSFDNFVPGSNGEALALLRGLATLQPGQPVRAAYLWGEPGCGKTHLLAALAAASGARALQLGPGSAPAEFATEVQGRVAIVDDCDLLDADAQEAAFHLYNRVRAAGDAVFVAAGSQPPRALALRDDLRTRLGWGAVHRLTLLTDDEKAEALRRAARGRGLALPEDLLRHLLTHRSRDIRALLRLLDALDRFALERKRPLTLPLLRQFDDAERAG